METYFDRYVIAGGIMMVLLVPCAVLAVGFAIQAMINLRRSRIAPPTLENAAQELNGVDDTQEFLNQLEQNPSSVARVVTSLRHKISENEYPPPEELQTLIEEEVVTLYQRNNQLAIIYTVAPLLGLLGTVIGMMKAFAQFSASETPSVALLGRGINEALVTTMWGLAIAIPSYIMLSIMKQRLFNYERDLLPKSIGKILQNVYRFSGKQE